MKQQFEVGDKAIWKGGAVLYANRNPVYQSKEYDKGVEIEIASYCTHEVKPWDYNVVFPDGTQAYVFADQIELPTPTTTVTVHGNENWKPEQEQIGWDVKDLDKFPCNNYDRKVWESRKKTKGFHIEVDGRAVHLYDIPSHPDFFSPVYSKGKPIEFTHWVGRQNLQIQDAGSSVPSDYKSINVFLSTCEQKPDVFVCYTQEGNLAVFLGHFNSGTI